jgi:hypothetical protein
MSLDLTTFNIIHSKLIDFQCLICMDEANVLVDHLGDVVISEMEGDHVEANGDVIVGSKIGTLSVLLWAIQEGQFAQKVVFAGTSNNLRNMDNFGSCETKAVSPTVLRDFSSWCKDMALKYVSSLVNIDEWLLKLVLVDYYRPRILENFAYDLFCIATNDTDSPDTLFARQKL